MTTHTLTPPKRYRVVIAGGVDAARDAVANFVGIHRPLKDVAVNGYDGVHATVWADPAQMRAWWDATMWGQRGALCFYREVP